MQSCGTDLDALQSIQDSVSNLLERLNSNVDETSSEILTEVTLPAPDSLLGQFTCRPVYTLVDISEDRLTTAYWLSAPPDEGETDAEHVS